MAKKGCKNPLGISSLPSKAQALKEIRAEDKAIAKKIKEMEAKNGKA